MIEDRSLSFKPFDYMTCHFSLSVDKGPDKLHVSTKSVKVTIPMGADGLEQNQVDGLTTREWMNVTHTFSVFLISSNLVVFGGKIYLSRMASKSLIFDHSAFSLDSLNNPIRFMICDGEAWCDPVTESVTHTSDSSLWLVSDSHYQSLCVKAYNDLYLAQSKRAESFVPDCCYGTGYWKGIGLACPECSIRSEGS